MKQQIGVIALLLAASTQAVSLAQMNTNAEAEQNKPGDSSNVDIDPESFAEASTNARIETDLEIAEGKSSENQNELWKKHFQSSEFYKNYQSHLQHRGEMTHIRNLNNQALSQIKGDYKNLQTKYNKLTQQAKSNWELGKRLSQQVPGGEKLFADQGPVSYENILLAEVIGDEEEAPKKVENILETVEESNSTLALDKDASNPFNQKDKDQKEKISAEIEDTAPAEEKEKWFMKDMPKVSAASQQTFEVDEALPSAPKKAKISAPVAKAIVKSAKAPTNNEDAEPVEPAVVQIADKEITEAPVQAPQPVSQVQTSSSTVSEPMASAILMPVEAPKSNELIKIGEKPDEAPQDEENIQLKALPVPITTSATVTTRPWSVTVIKTVNPPITGPAGSTIVSEWAKPIDDSPVLEPLDPAEMPVVKHENIYNNFPEERLNCTELN